MTLEVQTLAEWEAAGEPGMLSVVIPARDEAENIETTVERLVMTLEAEGITYEILIINDGSTDDTGTSLRRIASKSESVRFLSNPAPHGFGFAVRRGLAEFRGEFVAIVMADGSDAPTDVVRFYKAIQDVDCVFGTRFSGGGKANNYPLPKLILNRLANRFIQLLFMISCDDITNAFKMYRRSVVAGLQPLLAYHFNLTVELPLKAVVRGYSYTIVPNTWTSRTKGVSRFRIREMGSRYLFIIFYCYCERLFSKGDYGSRDAAFRRAQLQVWPR